MGLKRRFSVAKNIWLSFHSPKGKVYAALVIILHAVKLLARRLGIRLPGKLDYLSEPVGLTNLWALEERMKPLNIVVRANEPARVNVLLPALVPEIIFGGYIAMLNFILRLMETGYRVRIIVCEEVDKNEAAVRDACRRSSIANKVLEHAELLVAQDRSHEIAVSPKDVFVGYSWLTMRLASRAARATNGKLPIFFIQEFEAIFHPYDSFHALCMATYRLPHFAIFNSELLMRFFQRKKLSVFDSDNPASKLPHRYAYFPHAFSDIMPPSRDDLVTRKTKKLLFYARPEAHAARNIFEIGMMALRKALRDGVFDSNWEFYGIGSLALSDELELAEGVSLHMLPRVSLEEYCRMMRDFDVGLALMYAPHPSVPPFEMAAAGMLTVTTFFESRPAEAMEKISSNLIACRPDPESVAKGLQKAVQRVGEIDARLKGARFDWPRTWKDSFNDSWLSSLADVLPRSEIVGEGQ